MQMQLSQRHSLQQVGMLRQMYRAAELSPREAILTVTQLVNHGFSEAEEMLERLRTQLRAAPVRDYLEQLENRFRAIMALRHRQRIVTDPSLMHRLYHLDEPVLVRSETAGDDLMVMFPTVFNNYNLSNALFTAVLLDLGMSVLVLKDSSKGCFLQGVPRLGGSPEELAGWIGGFAARQGFANIHLTGFSSSGFASLYLSSLLPCASYTGFSIATNLAGRSAMPQAGIHGGQLFGNIAAQYLCDLRPRFENLRDSCRRHLIYGADNPVDAREAANMDLPGIELHRIENCSHQTPSVLLERGELLPLLRRSTGMGVLPN